MNADEGRSKHANTYDVAMRVHNTSGEPEYGTGTQENASRNSHTGMFYLVYL